MQRLCTMSELPKRVLVVDDSPAMRFVIARALQDLNGVVLDLACDGVEGLELFQREGPDVVVTDWSMPHADGLQLLRAIRLSGQRSHTPVLVLSRNFAQARVVEAIKAGANGFVPKPFPPAMLREKVNHLLELVPPLPPLSRAERRKVSRGPPVETLAPPSLRPAE